MNVNETGTPSLDNLINGIIDKSLYELNISIPGIVIDFSSTDKTCSVQPALKRKYLNAGIKELPIINDVPICYPQTNDAIISFPLEKGDNVLLVFSQRSLDNWKQAASAKTVDPEDTRRNHISDAVAIPGIVKKGGGIPAENGKMKIQYKNGFITIDSSNKFKIGNSSEELLGIINDTIGEIQNITTNTMLGPMPPNNIAAFAAIQGRLGALL